MRIDIYTLDATVERSATSASGYSNNPAASINPSSSPTVPEFPSAIIIVVSATIVAAVLSILSAKNSQKNKITSMNKFFNN